MYINFSFGYLAECKDEFKYSGIFGSSKFLERYKLQDRAQGLLPGDQLTILAEITVFNELFAQNEPACLLEKLKVQSLEHVKDTLGDILNSDDPRDVILEVDGGTELAAHKAILSAHSPVFSAMFNCEMSEQKEGKVSIPDMKVEVAQGLLRFLYTGEVANLDEYAEELLMAADKVSALGDLLRFMICFVTSFIISFSHSMTLPN